MKRYITIKKNPIFDWCIGQLAGGESIPTKQEKYKPLVGLQGVVKTEGEKDIILNELYVRNPDKDVVQRFEKSFREQISENIDESYPIMHPTNVEVVLNISVEKKRFYDVDVDNLAKTILDCLKGLVIEDDSQVVSLLVQKEIHPFNIPGIMIGLRKVGGETKSIFDGIKLYYYEESDEAEQAKASDNEEE